MINENRLYKDITGMEKILSIHPQFSWKKIKYIEAFNYYIDLNEFGERSSYLKILFWAGIIQSWFNESLF